MTTLVPGDRFTRGLLPDRVLDDALASGRRLPAGAVAVTPHHWDHRRTAVGVRILAEYAVERGRAYEEVLVGTGLSAEGLDEPGACVEAGQEIAVARNLLRMFGSEPGLGLEIGRRFHLTTFGLYGLLLMSSPLMVDVARRGLRLNGLTVAFSTVTAEITSDGRFAFGFRAPTVPADVRRFLMERELAAFATAQSELFAGCADLPLLSVRSEFAATGADPLVGRPIEFGSSETALVFESRYLARELPQASPHTARDCVALCEQALAERLDRRGATAAVRARLRRLGGRDDGIAAAARSLQMTDRTLRRRLTAEGTSYRRLVDEVRSDIARDLFAEGQLTATEVARRLGFSDLPSFLRAQRRWGETTGDGRRSA